MPKRAVRPKLVLDMARGPHMLKATILLGCRKTKHFLASFRNFADRAYCSGVLLFRDRRGIAQYLQVERGRHMVTLTQSLQSLELVDRLIELTVDRRLIAHESVDRRMIERLVFIARLL